MTGSLFTPFLQYNQPDYKNYDYYLSREFNQTYIDGNSESVTLSSGNNLIHAFVFAEGKIYAGTHTSPARIIRFNNLDNLSDYTVLTLANDGKHNNADDAVYVPSQNAIYFTTTYNLAIEVTKLSLDTFTATSVIDDATIAANGASPSIESDNSFLYVSTYTSPAKIGKYSLTDYSLSASQTLTGMNSSHASRYDGKNLYVSGGSSPAWIVKVNTSDLAYENNTFPTGYNQVTDDIASVGDYIYCPLELADPSGNAIIVRVRKSDLALYNIRTMSSGFSHWSSYFDGSNLWFGTNNGAYGLHRLDINTLEVDDYEVPTGVNSIVSDGKRLFLSTYESPSKIKRISVPNGAAIRNYINFNANSASFTGNNIFTSTTGDPNGAIEIKMFLAAANTKLFTFWNTLVSTTNPSASGYIDDTGNFLMGTEQATNVSFYVNGAATAYTPALTIDSLGNTKSMNNLTATSFCNSTGSCVSNWATGGSGDNASWNESRARTLFSGNGTAIATCPSGQVSQNATVIGNASGVFLTWQCFTVPIYNATYADVTIFNNFTNVNTFQNITTNNISSGSIRVRNDNWSSVAVMSDTYTNNVAVRIGNINIPALHGYAQIYSDTTILIYGSATYVGYFNGYGFSYNDAKGMILGSSGGGKNNDIYGFGSSQAYETGKYAQSAFLGVADINTSANIPGSRYYVMADASNYTVNYKHPPQLNPTLFIHSNTESPSQWLGLSANETTALISAGKNLVTVANASLTVEQNVTINGLVLESDGTSWYFYNSSGTRIMRLNQTDLAVRGIVQQNAGAL